MSEEITGYWGRLWGAVIGKQGPIQDKPEKPNHGAAWSSAGGVRAPYSQSNALSALGIHAYVHAAATRASQDLAALPLMLIRGKGENEEIIQNHEVLDLLAQPSTSTNGELFREQATIDLMLCGNAYVLLLGAGEKPVSLVRLHPGETEIVTTPGEGLSGYQHRSSGQTVEYPPDRVIHLRNSTYSMGPSSLYGVGAVESLKFDLDADINASKLCSSQSKQGRPDILLSPAEDGDIWPKETRKQVAESYAGLQKAGGALVLSGAVKMETLNLSPRDMEYQATRKYTRESISSVMGVPGSVLGLLSDANYATSKQQAIHYWSVQTKRGSKLETLFTAIAKKFDPELRVIHDYSGVEALQSVRTERLQRVQMHIFMGADPAAAYNAEGLVQPTSSVEIDNPSEDKTTGADVVARWFAPSVVRGMLPVSLDPSNPREQDEDEIERAILNTLGDGAPNWMRYQKAHLWSDPDRLQSREGYRFLIARLVDPDDPENATPENGDLVVFRGLLSRCVEELNTQRNGLAEEQRQKIYSKIKEYFAAMSLNAPPLTDVLLSFDEKKKSINKISTQKDRQWWTWLRRVHNPAEKALYRAVRRYMLGSLKRYEKRIREQVTESKSVEIHLRTVMSWKDLMGIAEEERIYIQDVGPTFFRHWQIAGTKQLEEIASIADIDLTVPFADREMANVAMGLAGSSIAKTSGSAVKAIIENGLVGGLSIENMAEQLAKSGSMSIGRATMIARTEATRAVNGAAVDAYREAASQGVEVKKEWMSARDGKVRPEHIELDGQTRYVENDFTTLSGDSADAPGGFGVPALDVNCRCTVSPKVIR